MRSRQLCVCYSIGIPCTQGPMPVLLCFKYQVKGSCLGLLTEYTLTGPSVVPSSSQLSSACPATETFLFRPYPTKREAIMYYHKTVRLQSSYEFPADRRERVSHTTNYFVSIRKRRAGMKPLLIPHLSLEITIPLFDPVNHSFPQSYSF